MAKETEELLRLDRQVCFPIYAATNLINRLYRPLLAEIGLTYPQYLVMLSLWEESPRPMSKLCELLYLDSGTLTPLLKRLQSSELLTRERNPADERKMIVTLTAKGDSLRHKAVEVPKSLLQQFEMNPSDLEGFRDLMQATVATLNEKLVSNKNA